MGYRVLAFILIAIALVLNFRPIDSSTLIGFAKTTASYAVYPFYKSASIFFSGSSSAALFIIRAAKYEDHIGQLGLEIEKLRAENNMLSPLSQENENLKAALNFKNNNAYKYNLVPANIVAREDKSYNAAIIIDAGEAKGIKAEQTVISSHGLVGKVIETTRYSSKVLLITSPQSSISVLVTKGGTYGIAKGGYGHNLNLEYIPENSSVEVNSTVVVSQSSKSYIPGIIVGRVLKVEKNYDNIFQKVLVKPETDFSKIGVVFVCR